MPNFALPGDDGYRGDDDESYNYDADIIIRKANEILEETFGGSQDLPLVSRARLAVHRWKHTIDALDAAEEEVSRLRECMRQAGLVAFLRDRSPEDIAEHLRSVIESYATPASERDAALKRVAALVPQLHATNARIALLVAVLKEIESGGCPCCGSEPWVNIDCHVCVAATEALKGSEA